MKGLLYVPVLSVVKPSTFPERNVVRDTRADRAFAGKSPPTGMATRASIFPEFLLLNQ